MKATKDHARPKVARQTINVGTKSPSTNGTATGHAGQRAPWRELTAETAANTRTYSANRK